MVYRDGPAYSSVPPDPGLPPRGSRFDVVRTRMVGSRPLVEPLLIIVIGLALGLVDQTSSEVSGMLRIPALIAALMLVGQGLNLLEDARNARAVQQVIEEREPVAVGAEDATLPPAPAQRQVVVAGGGEEGAESSRTPTRAYVVLGLAIWLGVATLAFPTAPLSLILLSLLSAYLLFARGWRIMQASSTE